MVKLYLVKKIKILCAGIFYEYKNRMYDCTMFCSQRMNTQQHSRSCLAGTGVALALGIG